jgi:plastocyanin
MLENFTVPLSLSSIQAITAKAVNANMNVFNPMAFVAIFLAWGLFVSALMLISPKAYSNTASDVKTVTNTVEHGAVSTSLAAADAAPQHTIAASISSQIIRVLSPEADKVSGLVVYLLPQFPLDAQNLGEVNTVHSDNVVEVHQNNKQFTPYISVVQRNKAVDFVNDDNITHHIYSALGPKRFSFKLRSEQSSDTMIFDQAGHVSMGCNIHDWMSGHLLVVDTPFYGISNQQGQVVFEHLPQGDYQVVLWHPQLPAKGHTQIHSLTLSGEAVSLILQDNLSPIPEQKSLDDFDFLEAY